MNAWASPTAQVRLHHALLPLLRVVCKMLPGADGSGPWVAGNGVLRACMPAP